MDGHSHIHWIDSVFVLCRKFRLEGIEANLHGEAFNCKFKLHITDLLNINRLSYGYPKDNYEVLS